MTQTVLAQGKKKTFHGQVWCTDPRKIVRCSIENKDVKVSSIKVGTQIINCWVRSPRSFSLFLIFFFLIREKKWKARQKKVSLRGN